MNSPLATFLFSAFKRSRQAAEPMENEEEIQPEQQQQQPQNPGTISSSIDYEKDPIKTFVRLKPCSKNVSRTIEIIDQHTVQMTAPEESHAFRTRNRHEGKYKFTAVFDESVTQEQFFNATTMDVLRDVLKGRSGTLAAYGVTNSGKTHTIFGSSSSVADAGLLFRALRIIFQSTEQSNQRLRPLRFNEVEEYESVSDEFWPSDVARPQHKSVATSPTAKKEKVLIWISAIESYNDKLFDLFEDIQALQEEERNRRRPTVEIKHCRLGGNSSVDCTYLSGARQIRVRSYEEAVLVTKRAMKQRQVFSTLANRESSRSHRIISIQVIGSSPDSAVTSRRLMFVDLAGSERHKLTQTEGARIREAGEIHKTLSALQNCIAIIRANQSDAGKKSDHIPFRNSKLTQILQNDLSGLGRLCLIVNVNPSPEFYDETTHVMEFSAIAREVQVKRQRTLDTGLMAVKNIKKKLVFNESSSKSASVSPAKATIDQQSLTGVTNESQIRQEMIENQAKQIERLRAYYETAMKQLGEETEQKFGHKIDILSQTHEREILKLHQHIKSLESELLDKEKTLSALSADNGSDKYDQMIQSILAESESRMHSIEKSTQAELLRMREQIEEQARLKDREIVKLKRRLVKANEASRKQLQEIGAMEYELEELKNYRQANEKEIKVLREKRPLIEVACQTANTETLVDFECQTDISLTPFRPGKILTESCYPSEIEVEEPILTDTNEASFLMADQSQSFDAAKEPDKANFSDQSQSIAAETADESIEIVVEKSLFADQSQLFNAAKPPIKEAIAGRSQSGTPTATDDPIEIVIEKSFSATAQSASPAAADCHDSIEIVIESPKSAPVEVVIEKLSLKRKSIASPASRDDYHSDDHTENINPQLSSPRTISTHHSIKASQKSSIFTQDGLKQSFKFLPKILAPIKSPRTTRTMIDRDDADGANPQPQVVKKKRKLRQKKTVGLDDSPRSPF